MAIERNKKIITNLLFNQLRLSGEVQKALDEMGFEETTPIQSQAIPPILEGSDVLGQAQTGTGKTCAFGIPAIERLNPDISGTQVLILCPTRELAIQVSEELKKVAKYKKKVSILPIYGGQSIDRQIFALKAKPQIIVGTPGRVMDHMRRRTLKLNVLTTLILDEADEMLNMGFREDIDIILKEVPSPRQTLLFSATISKEIREIINTYQTNPVHIKTIHKELSAPQISQYYIEVRESAKVEVLSRLIDANNISLGLIFCNTKRRVDNLTEALQARGYAAEALHGDMKQSERTRVMNKFRKGSINLLIATDVAARGIDINDIEAVFNYDLPNDEEYYVHRIGRTGRATKTGVSYTFIFGREIYKLRDIQKYSKSVITQIKPPSISDIEGTKIEVVAEKVKKAIESGGYSKYINTIENLIATSLVENNDENQDFDPQESAEENITSIDVAAALFKMIYEENIRTYDEELDEQFTKSFNSDFNDSDNRERRKNNTRSGGVDRKTGVQMVRIFVNAGAMDQLQPGNLVHGIASKTSMSGDKIGSIEIHKNFSFVEVPLEFADEVLASMTNFTFKGRKIFFEKASKRDRHKPSQSSASKRKRYGKN